ncbi:protein SPT2 homolog [Anopheles bellator]|uniref:protein SPT2 homolog n=1 Tax=Anopheles bellator TaxID=139047 RepID=UPI0026470156|nr:protein SPT2 homolog [Anopheles bellator]XP_058058897.1 protein SPT2 homolog [Anopheles bellator]
MTSVQNQEDLEARIARIKKRNEEIEQKYREAEEDRLRAMKENAMVEIRPPKDDDWPREHKYDKVDFNYDLDPEALAQLEEKKKEKNAFIQKIAKDYKVFAEGEGPPPDPAYSFLADVERDGDKAVSPGQPSNIPNAPVGNSNGARSPLTRGDHFDRRNPHNRSGQRQGGHVNGAGPGGGGRGRGSSGKAHHGHHHPSVQRSYSTNEHDGWRSASGEQQRKNQVFHKGTAAAPEGGGGLWRREPYVADGPEKGATDDATSAAAKLLEPNLTVSISRDGEFKSVKVTTPPIIGSGRVGPRHPPKPQFQFHAGPGETQHNHSRQGGGHQQNHLPVTAVRKQSESTDHFNRNTTARKSDRGAAGEPTRKATGGPKGGSAGTHKNGTSSSGSGSASVQDRLNRNRQLGGSDKNDNHLKPTGSTPSHPAPVSGAAKATFKAISKIIEKNAAIDEQLLRENEKLPSKVKELRLQHPTAAEQ